MNLQHVEKFCHVVRYGGISAAVRHMPHGIQQPALSKAMAELEREVGAKLFERHPFRLLDAGRELLALAEPFLGGCAALCSRLRDRRVELRIAHSDVVPPEFIAYLLASLEADHPGLRCTLSPALWPDLTAQLRSGAIDVAFTVRSPPEPAGFSSLNLVRLPLALLVSRRSGIRRLDYFWGRSHITDPLIVPASTEGIAQAFTRGLRQAKIRWERRIEASSLRDALGLVAAGAGVALTLNASWLVGHPQVRVLPLAGFQLVDVAAFWRPPPNAAVRHVVQSAAKGRRAQILSAATSGRRRADGRRRTADGGQ